MRIPASAGLESAIKSVTGWETAPKDAGMCRIRHTVPGSRARREGLREPLACENARASRETESLLGLELDPAVEGADLSRIVAGDRLRLAEADCRQTRGRHAPAHQVAANGLSAPLGQALVVGVGADRVRVSFDADVH